MPPRSRGVTHRGISETLSLLFSKQGGAMISCISCANAHEFGRAYHSQFRLRYGSFVERQQYDVSVYEGMEFDKYDTPASRYLVYHADDGTALGVSRLSPTILSCMLEDLWPHLVKDKSLLRSHAVWEGTRYCVAKDVPPDFERTHYPRDGLRLPRVRAAVRA
jgi:acyl homoserine lactone synthase